MTLKEKDMQAERAKAEAARLKDNRSVIASYGLRKPSRKSNGTSGNNTPPAAPPPVAWTPRPPAPVISIFTGLPIAQPAPPAPEVSQWNNW
jgi:hypothetical protein